MTERRQLDQILSDLAGVRDYVKGLAPSDPRVGRMLSLYHALCEEASEQDRWSFCRTLVKTQDDHDSERPFKPFPDLQYTLELMKWWQELSSKPGNRVGFVYKSRQMMVSWTAVAMVLWSCLFEEARTIGWQSKKAEDANWMLKRMLGVWERLPEAVKKRHPCEYREGELRFPGRSNVVMAVPEGPDKPRQYTWSLFISDEMAFQEQARETYTSVQPAIRGGGIYLGISSAAPGFFQEMVQAEVNHGSYKVLIPTWFKNQGMSRWSTKKGSEILWIHHSADPSKNDEWAHDAAKVYGGRDSGGWLAEFDGEFGAYAGGLVYPEFSRASHVIPYFDPPEDFPIYRAIDPGLDNPLCCLFAYVDPATETLIVFDEHYLAGCSEIERHAQIIKAKTGKHPVSFSVMDRSAFSKTLAGGGSSVAEMFVRYGVPTCEAHRAAHKRDLVPVVSDLMHVRDNGEPHLKIMENCANLIRELQNYRWRPKLREDKNSPDEPVDVDDHACDALAYLCKAVSPKHSAEMFRQRDPLARYYTGQDRRRTMADDLRIKAVMRDRSEDEP